MCNSYASVTGQTHNTQHSAHLFSPSLFKEKASEQKWKKISFFSHINEQKRRTGFLLEQEEEKRGNSYKYMPIYSHCNEKKRYRLRRWLLLHFSFKHIIQTWSSETSQNGFKITLISLTLCSAYILRGLLNYVWLRLTSRYVHIKQHVKCLSIYLALSVKPVGLKGD